MTPSAQAPAVLLLWGEDAFLLREAALESLEGIDPAEVDGEAWQGGETADLATPSLFGEPRALLVTNARALTDRGFTELGAYLAAPSPDARLVLMTTVPERGKVPAALAKLVKDRGQVREEKVDRKDLTGWTVRRAKRRDVDLAPDAAAALVETLGGSPAELDQAVVQLGSAFAGQRVTRAQVESQFRGLGEQRVWDLCDRMFGRDLPGSVRALRSLLGAREEPLLILGVIAARVRDLIRVRDLPDRVPPDEIKQRTGLRFDWQVRRYREQARRFGGDELLRVHERVVEADRVLKSGVGVAGEVVLTSLVTSVAAGG